MKANVFLVLGVALLLVGVSMKGFVTVTVIPNGDGGDTTGPEFLWTVPEIQADYKSPVAITALLFDRESVVTTVKFRYSSDSGSSWTLITLRHTSTFTSLSIDSTEETVSMWRANPISLATGVYAYEFEATNEAGLTTVFPNSLLGVLQDWFSVQAELEGKWQINNKEVTSPDQTLMFSGNQLHFQFEATTGLSSGAQIKWTGQSTGQLSLETVQEAQKYDGTATFADGTYKIDLIASDTASPPHDIVMASVEVNVGQQEPPIIIPPLPPLPFDTTSIAFMAVGACLVVYGFARKRRMKA